MNHIAIQGVGAVSPAGWRVADLLQSVDKGMPAPTTLLDRPGRPGGLRVRRVPVMSAAEAWARHPRLRRASPITRFATAAALAALGEDVGPVGAGALRLGVVYCVMAGCVNYSSRFYQEVLKDPATASPLVFPETVFNAPASHLAALLGTAAINYAQVGDDSTFVSGLTTACGWLLAGRVDGCLVIGAEECDWLTAEAMGLFCPRAVLAEGAGAVYLKRADRGVLIETITDAFGYRTNCSRVEAARAVRRQLEQTGPAQELTGSASAGDERLRGEVLAWNDWPGRRWAPRALLGDALCAASAWQVILAAESLRTRALNRVYVSVAGCNQAAVGMSLVDRRTG